MSAQPLSRRTSRLTLAAIVAVALLAAAIGGVLGSYLVGARGASLSPLSAHVPMDAVMYAELRMDLSPEQRTRFGEVLARFPGLDPDSILGDGLDALLDDALAGAGAPYSYSRDVRSWFNGSVVMATLDYPTSTDPMAVELPGIIVALGSTDRSAAEWLAQQLRSDVAAGASFSSTTHDGTTIWSLDVDPWTAQMMGGAGFAYAVTDEALLLSMTSDDIVTALDVRAGRRDGIGQHDRLSGYLARLPGDHAMLVVSDAEPMMSQLTDDLALVDPALAAAITAILDGQPRLSVAVGRFESDGLRFDAISDAPTGAFELTNARRSLAAAVPDDALFYAESGSIGPMLEQVIAGMKAGIEAAPGGTHQTRELELVESALGGSFESFVAWIGDGAMAAGWDGSQPYVGFVLDATDVGAAGARLRQLTSLARLATGDPGAAADLRIEEREHAGVQITGLRMAMPPDMAISGTDEFVIEYAVHGERVLLGFGDRFVQRSLDLDADGGLAASSRFTAAFEPLGGTNASSLLYLDLAGIRAAVESVLPADMAMGYGMVAPYLEPFDHVASVTRLEGDRAVGVATIILD